MELTGYIYEIRCIENGKSYIGQSIDIDYGLSMQISRLREDRHSNNSLQIDWNVYGEDRFQFSILRECEEEFIDIFEDYYINIMNSSINGYNKETNIHDRDCGIPSIKIPRDMSNLESLSIKFNIKELILAYTLEDIIYFYPQYGLVDSWLESLGDMGKNTLKEMRDRLDGVIYTDEIRTDTFRKLEDSIKEKISSLYSVDKIDITIDRIRKYNYATNIIRRRYIEINLGYKQVAIKGIKVYMQ